MGGGRGNSYLSKQNPLQKTTNISFRHRLTRNNGSGKKKKNLERFQSLVSSLP